MKQLGDSLSTTEEVRDAIESGDQRYSFRIDVLDTSHTLLGTLGQGEHENTYADAPGTLTVSEDRDTRTVLDLTVIDGGTVEWNEVFLQPHAILTLPDGRTRDWAMATVRPFIPPEDLTPAAKTLRITAPDKGIYLSTPLVEPGPDVGFFQLDGTDSAGLGFRAGTSYTLARRRLARAVGIPDDLTNILDLSKTLSRDFAWELGQDTFARAMTQLCEAINERWWFDEDGILTTAVQTDITTATPDWTYATDNKSLIGPLVRGDYDLTRTANRIIVRSNSAQGRAFGAVAENHNPESPISYERLGYWISKVIQVDTLNDQSEAQRRADLEIQWADTVYERREVPTVFVPHHSAGAGDLIRLEIPEHDLSATYRERSWSTVLAPGLVGQHNLSRVAAA